MVSSIRNRSPAGDKTPLMKSIQKSLSFGRGSGLDASSVSPRKLLCGIVTGLVFVGALLIFLSGLKSISLSPSGTRYFDNFITVDGLEFKDGDEPFYVVGFNVDSIMEAAIPSVSPRVNVPGISSGRERIKDLLQQASTSGLNVLRTWAQTVNPEYPLQTSPGQYNEDVFEALDFVVAEAGAAGIRVVLSLTDQWRYRGGVGEYTDWSPFQPVRDARFPPLIIEGDVTPESMTPERTEYEAKRQANFFTDSGVKDIYKHHMESILNRKNAFTGVLYKDDPTIMAFGLLNEPRCLVEHSPGCTSDVQQWVAEMSKHFKSIDSKHLLTIGEEGFFGLDDSSVIGNPGAIDGSSWGAQTGQDFMKNHAIEDIDYATMHLWPNNWFKDGDENLKDFVVNWINFHKVKAKELNKPLLLEEVGFKLDPSPADADTIASLRDPVMRDVYRRVESSLANEESLRGSLFWELDFKVYKESPANPYGIRFNDSTFTFVKDHARRMKIMRGVRNGSGCFRPWSGSFTAGCESALGMCQQLLEGHAAWDSQDDDVPFASEGYEDGNTGMMQLFVSQKDCCSANRCGLKFPWQ